MLRYVYNNIVAALGLRAARRFFLLNESSSLLSKTFLVLLRAADYGVWGSFSGKAEGGWGVSGKSNMILFFQEMLFVF